MVMFHADFYQDTILYQGIEYITEVATDCRLAAKWTCASFSPAQASYVILEALQNLFATLSSLASNANPADLLEVSVPGSSPPLQLSLVPSKVSDATLASDTDIHLAQWRQATLQNFRHVSGLTNSLSLTLRAPCKDVIHYLFLPNEKLQIKPTSAPDDTPANPPKAKRARTDRPDKPEPTRNVLDPVAPHSISDIIDKFQKGEITQPRMPPMTKIHSPKGLRLCLPFLLGGKCPNHPLCREYHLSANLASHLPGESREDYKPLHTWIRTYPSLFRLSTKAASNDKLCLKIT